MNRIATTAKGWTDNVTCLEWFRKTFIPQATARRESPEETIILVMDGHESHKTPEMKRLALEHNIEFFLPPHTTHRLQPLDVGVFGPLQRKWQERCDEVIGETNGEIPRSHFVKEYMDVRNKVFTKELIQSAWKKAGIWPKNSSKFTEKDFAPSKLMSYTASLPPGYPELPEAPDMLVFTGESVCGEGEGDDKGPADGVVSDSSEMSDDDGASDGEGVETDDGGDDEMNDDDTSDGEDDGVTDGEDDGVTDGEDDGVTDGMTGVEPYDWTGDLGGGMTVGEDGSVDVGEALEDTIVGGVNTMRCESQSLRYVRKPYRWNI
jgi:hypothetical protein